MLFDDMGAVDIVGVVETDEDGVSDSDAETAEDGDVLGDDVAADDSRGNGLIDGVSEIDVEGIAGDDKDADGEALEGRD